MRGAGGCGLGWRPGRRGVGLSAGSAEAEGWRRGRGGGRQADPSLQVGAAVGGPPCPPRALGRALGTLCRLPALTAGPSVPLAQSGGLSCGLGSCELVLASRWPPPSSHGSRPGAGEVPHLCRVPAGRPPSSSCWSCCFRSGPGGQQPR